MIGEARPMPAPAITALMRELLDSLRARLREPMATLFDTLDDTLFELGEHARSGASQQLYFDALRECRRKRNTIVENFLATVGSTEATRSGPVHPLHAQLSLMAPEDLEEGIAIENMAARTATRLSGPLYTLSQRFGYLLGDASMDAVRNPLGPAHIGKAFRSVAATLEVDMQTRLVLYKLFERHVLGALEPAYTEMNVRLAAAGVLPTLNPRQTRERPAPPTQQARPAASAPTQQVVARHVPAPAPNTPNTDLRATDLLSALRVLLTREQDTTAETPVAVSPHKTIPAAEVMDRAMARLRARPLEGKPLPPPRLLAAQLLAEARYADDGLPPTPLQSATLDIVGRVFDALGHDRTVPRLMQPVMQTMLLPVMRASLRQPGMLAENNHPLRQLFDLLAENAVGWCPKSDPGESLLSSLRTALQQIAGSEQVEDADRVVIQLRSQLEHQRRRAELSEQRVVEATAGRERLWQARRQVHLALSSVLARAPVPAWVHYLITRPWANCLVLLWLRHGIESPAYREAFHFAESLVWCANAGADRVEQLRLRALLPVMEIQLRQGLATVAYQDNEISRLVLELRQFLRYRMGDLPAPDFLEQEPPAAAAPGALAADPGNIEDQPLPQQINPDLLAEIRSLRPGTWFEFNSEAESGERARLSWVSPYSGRCLFVDRNGVKIAERRPEDIAHDVERGAANILESAQMLERALAQVLAQLRGDVTQAKRA